MLFGRSITLWTARLSMALLAVSFIHLLRLRSGKERQEATRPIWTFACAVLVLHVAAAFQFVHHWSNTDAVRAASDQTRQLLGFGFGGGIYAGYAFLMLWILDVIVWWAAPSWRERRPAVRATMIAIAAFMAFNAAVVFAPAPSRWVGLFISVILMTMIFARFFQHRRPADSIFVARKVS